MVEFSNQNKTKDSDGCDLEIFSLLMFILFGYSVLLQHKEI